jgi:hypothetical protein
VAEVLQEFNALDFMLECRVVFSWAEVACGKKLAVAEEVAR